MVELLTPQVQITPHARGVVLQARAPLPAPVRCVGEWLSRWARERPDVTFLAERDAANEWHRMTYAAAATAVDGVASALLELGGRPDRPVMILSDNSVRSAVLALGAMQAGLPVSPVSSAYSLMSKTFGRLREVLAQLVPGFVYAEEPTRFASALAAIDRDGVTRLAAAGDSDHLGLDALMRTPRSATLERVQAGVGPDTIAKILFTSGSTGRPKGVVNTQRMLTSNQESLFACWPFLARTPPVVADWLPWSHTFGGNHNFFLILRNGGSLFIDSGRPAPGLIDVTIDNLADVKPTIWFNVPRGFDQALTRLEEDPAAARAVFQNLEVVFYAAAALSPSTRTRLEAVAAAAGRPDVFFTSAWGSTETSPLATSAHFFTRAPGILGVPVPGVQLRLAPTGGRLELRVRGPNVTPGYWQPGGMVEPAALDPDGFLPTGDAGHLVDPEHPEAGVAFGGRLSENFKLSSGTWVTVGHVRIAVVDACAPLLQDAVIAGHDREGIGALLFPAPAARALPEQELQRRLTSAIAAHNRAHPGNSERIQRACVSLEPLSLDEGETTDKGYTNQARVLERRGVEVERLFAEPVDPSVYDLPRGEV